MSLSEFLKSGTRLSQASSLAALAGFALTASSAHASAITDFHIFGGTSTSIGGSVGTTTMRIGPIGSNGDVSIGTSAKVTDVSSGGNVGIGGSTTVGETTSVADVVADGDITMGANTIVSGNVDAGGNGTFHPSASRIGGNLTLGGTISAGNPDMFNGGTITENGSPVAHMPVAVPGASNVTSSGVDGAVSIANSGTASIAPGQYTTLTTGTGSNLELTTPGEYRFDSISQTGNTLNIKLDLDDGPFTILVDGTVQFGTGLNFFDLSTGIQLNPTDATDSLLGDQLYLEVAGNFQGGGSSLDWFGTIFAPNGDVFLGTSSRFAGALYAGGTMTVNPSVQGKFVLAENLPDQFSPPPPPPPTTGISEPGTLALMGLGLAGIGIMRRRSQKRD